MTYKPLLVPPLKLSEEALVRIEDKLDTDITFAILFRTEAEGLIAEVRRLRVENEALLYTSDKQANAWKARALKAEKELEK